MNTELASLVVIVLIVIGTFTAHRAYTNSQKRKAEALTSPKKMNDWMAAQGFAPDHFSFFHGTGVALKDGDTRIVLYMDGTARFYPIAELVSINAHEATERSIPRGAAPGIVSVELTQRFIIDITVKNVSQPCKLLLSSKDESRLWENRLSALIGSTN